MKTGKKRWWLAVFVLAAIILPVGFHLFQNSREPRYEGRPVSYWFKQYYLDRDHESPEHDHFETMDALNEMGTNALPYLLKQAFNTKQDTTIGYEFYQFLDKLPKSWHLPKFVSWDSIRDHAANAIDEMEPPASVILPLVRKELDETNSPNHYQAIRILSSIREGAEILVPVFAKALHDEDDGPRKHAMEALGALGPAAAAAVPDLMHCLQEPWDSFMFEGFSIQVNAAGALGGIGSNAAPAIPLLFECLQKETNREDRFDFATALLRIDARQTNALNFLIDGLQNPKTSEEPGEIATRLGKIGTNAGPAVPALLEALNTADRWDLETIAGALKEVGAPKESYLPKLREKLRSKDEDLAVEAAGLIYEIDKSDSELRTYWIDEIRNHGKSEAWAVENLSDTGQSPDTIIPIIAVALEGTNMVSWYYAGHSLKKLGAPPELYLPKFKNSMKSKDDAVRVRMARLILELDPADHEAVLVMIDLIKNNTNYAAGAIVRLGKVGPATKEAVPVIKDALKSKDAKIRKAATEALKQIEAQEKGK